MTKRRARATRPITKKTRPRAPKKSASHVRGWETRRANERKKEYQRRYQKGLKTRARNKRSAAARQGAETKRQRALQKAERVGPIQRYLVAFTYESPSAGATPRSVDFIAIAAKSAEARAFVIAFCETHVEFYGWILSVPWTEIRVGVIGPTKPDDTHGDVWPRANGDNVDEGEGANVRKITPTDRIFDEDDDEKTEETTDRTPARTARKRRHHSAKGK